MYTCTLTQTAGCIVMMVCVCCADVIDSVVLAHVSYVLTCLCNSHIVAVCFVSCGVCHPQYGMEHLEGQVRALRRVHVSTVDVRAAPDAREPDQPRLLSASFAIVRALDCTSVDVSGWAASGANIEALAGLPANARLLTLRLRSAATSAAGQAAVPIARLPSLIPGSYKQWRLDTTALTYAEVEAFVRNAPTDRTAERPLSIQLSHDHNVPVLGFGVGYEGKRAMVAALRAVLSTPHVTLL